MALRRKIATARLQDYLLLFSRLPKTQVSARAVDGDRAHALQPLAQSAVLLEHLQALLQQSNDAVQELSVKAGSVARKVVILNELWWFGEVGAGKGSFPASYARLASGPTTQMVRASGQACVRPATGARTVRLLGAGRDAGVVCGR